MTPESVQETGSKTVRESSCKKSARMPRPFFKNAPRNQNPIRVASHAPQEWQPRIARQELMYQLPDPLPMPVILLLLLGTAFSLLTIAADLLFEKRKAKRFEQRKREHRRYMMQSNFRCNLMFRYSPDETTVYTYLINGAKDDRELKLIDTYKLR